MTAGFGHFSSVNLEKKKEEIINPRKKHFIFVFITFSVIYMFLLSDVSHSNFHLL